MWSASSPVDSAPSASPLPPTWPTGSPLAWFRAALPADWFAPVYAALGQADHAPLFGSALVCWLLIWQYLHGPASLQAAVDELLSGRCDPLLPTPTARTVPAAPSSATGAYSRARSRLPVGVADAVADRLYEQLHAALRGPQPPRPPLYLLDGSTVITTPTPSLTRAYPPSHNQHGVSPWPVLRLVLAYELGTGLAVRPAWGPQYGPSATSEQALAAEVLPRLPTPGLVLADRNFGVFSVLWAATQAGHQVLTRLTIDRVRKILGRVPRPGEALDVPLVWTPSRQDRRTTPTLPADAALAGRVVVRWFLRDGQLQGLFLFTTHLTAPAEALAAAYRWRWTVETDLRTLKQTVHLELLRSRTPGMVHKELVLAVSAYNLVRAVMAQAAAEAGLEPRQLSFTGTRTLLEAWAPLYEAAASEEDVAVLTRRLFRAIAQRRLPQRRTPQRASPRAVHGQPRRYPTRRSLHKPPPPCG